MGEGKEKGGEGLREEMSGVGGEVEGERVERGWIGAEEGGRAREPAGE